MAEITAEEKNGWSGYQRLVLAELTRHNATLEGFDSKLGVIKDELNTKLGKIETDIVMLQVKSGMWGALAGMIPVMFALLMYWLTKGTG